MENTLATILMIVFLLIGVVGGVVLTPEKTVEVPGETETIYQNVSVTEYIDLPAINQLELAVAEFLISVEDEEDEAGNDVDVLGSYDFDEVEVSKVYDEYSVEYDDDKTTVDFRIKLRFDEDGEASEKETFDVTVIFEDGEDTEVEVA